MIVQQVSTKVCKKLVVEKATLMCCAVLYTCGVFFAFSFQRRGCMRLLPRMIWERGTERAVAGKPGRRLPSMFNLERFL